MQDVVSGGRELSASLIDVPYGGFHLGDLFQGQLLSAPLWIYIHLQAGDEPKTLLSALSPAVGAVHSLPPQSAVGYADGRRSDD